MHSGSKPAAAFRTGAYQRRIALVFGLQLAAVLVATLMGIYDIAPVPAVLALIAIVSALAWLAARREWRPVSALARVVDGWAARPDIEALQPERFPHSTDADVVALARGLHGFASRLSQFNERERSFTRDASHELRSPLTVIKMSADMLADESGVGEFGTRSVQRIKRAAREMESLVEALLILAREADEGGAVAQNFVVNDVLRDELEYARDVLEGRPIRLLLEEPARFALYSSSRAFAVLCWQLIRNACQQIDQGAVVVTVMPGMISVAPQAEPASAARGGLHAVDRNGFELAIAQRISDRFAWPLELVSRPGAGSVASIRFPAPLPADG
jgi:signal transduction histidine kinase